MHYRLWTYTQDNYLKRVASFTVLILLFHCEYFIPISNLCVSLRFGTVGSYLKVAEQHGHQPEAAGLTQKPHFGGYLRYEPW